MPRLTQRWHGRAVKRFSSHDSRLGLSWKLTVVAREVALLAVDTRSTGFLLLV